MIIEDFIDKLVDCADKSIIHWEKVKNPENGFYGEKYITIEPIDKKFVCVFYRWVAPEKSYMSILDSKKECLFNIPFDKLPMEKFKKLIEVIRFETLGGKSTLESMMKDLDNRNLEK